LKTECKTGEALRHLLLGNFSSNAALKMKKMRYGIGFIQGITLKNVLPQFACQI
jgi:hypothetical protein